MPPPRASHGARLETGCANSAPRWPPQRGSQLPPGPGRPTASGGRGGGRKARTHHDPDLVGALEAFVEPTTRGGPQSPLRWPTKTTRKLADQLTRTGHSVSATTVATLLRRLKYRLHALRKTTEGASHPDRAHSSSTSPRRPAPCRNVASRWFPSTPRRRNWWGTSKRWAGMATLGAARAGAHARLPGQAVGQGGAVRRVRRHRQSGLGQRGDRPRHGRVCGGHALPLVAANGRLALCGGDRPVGPGRRGGSNSSRSRRWKVELQRVAGATGLRIHVCHYPPGTSKWNKIEHGMFSQITQNWRGRPLVSHEVIVGLIGHTTTQTGLRI